MAFLLPESVLGEPDKEAPILVQIYTNIIIQNNANRNVLQKIFGEINERSPIIFKQI